MKMLTSTVLFVGLIVFVVVGTVRKIINSNTATSEEAKARVEAMTYQRDGRTGLCFAVFCWHDETRSVSNVPCTPEVVSQIGGK